MGLEVTPVNNVRVTLRGKILTDDTGISTDAAAENTKIVVGRSGEVLAGGNGIVAQGDGVTVINKGLVSSGGVAGVFIAGEHGTLVNSGKITGDLYGFYGASNGGSYVNSGVIKSANSVGVLLTTTSSASSFSFENAGKIVGNIGVVMLETGLGVLLNEGTIVGRDGFGVQAGTGVQQVVNDGTIIGDVLLGGGDDVYFASGSGFVDGVVSGGAGADRLTGASRADTLYGDDGDDVLNGRGGKDILYGGGQNDTLNGGGGDDRLYGEDGFDWIEGGNGKDRLYGGNDNDDLFGGSGNDILNGGAQDDNLYGGSGNDVLKGGDGQDTIFVGTGNDKMWGGADADTFVFDENNAGTNRIKDFEDGVDTIDLAHYGITNVARFLNKAVRNVNGNVEIDLTKVGAVGKIIIEDMNKQDLDASDFNFLI